MNKLVYTAMEEMMRKMLTATFCIVAFGCKDAGNNSNHTVDTTAVLTWSVDTLPSNGSPQVIMSSLWGSSAQDLWAVGDNVNLSANIYHYDGTHWESFPAISAMPYRISYRSVTGFSKTDVYAIGRREYFNPRPGVNYEDSSLIVHFDGIRWSVMHVPPGRGLLTIWGKTPADIWAGGDFGTLFHYDGTAWIKQYFDSTQSIMALFGFGSGELYSLSTFYDVFNNPDTAYGFFNEYLSGTWIPRNLMKVTNVLYSFGFGDRGMWGASPNSLYSFGPKLYKRVSGSWEFVFGESHLFNDMRGTSGDNMFLVGDHGVMYHYDGATWRSIQEYRGTIVRLVSVMPFDRQVYVLANYSNQSYVLHGQLR